MVKNREFVISAAIDALPQCVCSVTRNSVNLKSVIANLKFVCPYLLWPLPLAGKSPDKLPFYESFTKYRNPFPYLRNFVATDTDAVQRAIKISGYFRYNREETRDAEIASKLLRRHDGHTETDVSVSHRKKH